MTRNERDRHQEFVRDVLDRTSGSACGRALAALPALNDDELAGLDRSLVKQHLAHCDGCRAAALALTWLGEELAGMAELDPGPGFTAAVVDRTSAVGEPARARHRARVAGTGPAGLMDRIGRWWSERILAPNFALQAAYVATVVMVLVFATPISPLRGTPERVLQTVQAGPTNFPLLGPVLQWSSDQVVGGSDHLRADVAGQWQRVEDDWQGRVQRSGPGRRGVTDHVAAAWRAARDRQSDRVTVEINGALRSGKTAWRAWWYEDSE